MDDQMSDALRALEEAFADGLISRDEADREYATIQAESERRRGIVRGKGKD